MSPPLRPAAFFDIGDTLGTPRVAAGRLDGLDVFPYVPGVLEDLRGGGVRLGILSNTGDETRANLDRVLKEAGLYAFFAETPELLIFSSEVGMTKDSPEIFAFAAERAGLAGSAVPCLFVGESPAERAFAKEAGLRVAAHPLDARAVLVEP